MRAALHRLAEDFDRYTVPEDGPYVKAPAIADNGTTYRKPPRQR
jgi:hypothetical protein